MFSFGTRSTQTSMSSLRKQGPKSKLVLALKWVPAFAGMTSVIGLDLSEVIHRETGEGDHAERGGGGGHTLDT